MMHVSPALHLRRFKRRLLLAFAILNLIAWFAAPDLHEVSITLLNRQRLPNSPPRMFGVQELLVYFDPWLAIWIFPQVFTIGFVLISFLDIETRDERRSTTLMREVMQLLGLLVLEWIWVGLIVIAAVCRGPNWNFFWPWEDWDPFVIQISNYVNFSDYYWVWLRGLPLPREHWIRELPGYTVLTVYFLLGVFCALLRSDWKLNARFVRFALLNAIWLMALLVPLKIVTRHIFALKYWIFCEVGFSV